MPQAVGRFFRSPFEQEDAVQEVWLSIYRYAGSFDPAQGELGAWIWTVATNRCREILRTSGRRLDLNSWVIRRGGGTTGDAFVPTVGVGGRIAWRWQSGLLAEVTAGYLHAWVEVDGRARGTGTGYGEAGVGYAF